MTDPETRGCCTFGLAKIFLADPETRYTIEVLYLLGGTKYV